MDNQDRHILSQLDRNGRMSLAEIGRQIGLSRNAVRNRITRMEETGVIRGFRVVQGDGGVAQERGLIFLNFAEGQTELALKWLSELPATRRVWTIGGEWDAVLAVNVAGPADLERLNTNIANRPVIARSVPYMVGRAL